MASSSSSVCPAVLTLAKQTGQRTVDDQYEITLPFQNILLYHSRRACSCRKKGNGSCVRCARAISFAQVKQKALQQTKKHWAWFSEASKLDHRLGRQLGTLGYLPLEIREMIWHAAIEDCMDASVEMDCFPTFWGGPKHTYKWEYGPLDMDITPEIVLQPHDDEAQFGINFHSKYLFHRSWQRNGVPQLRKASPDVNSEVENVVSNYPFRFRCPVVLGRYLNTASAQQINRLRTIIIELSGCCQQCCGRSVPWRSWFKTCGQGWIAAIERLPAIKLIRFELEQNYLYLGDPSRYVNEVFAQFEILSKWTKRLVPNAEIQASDLRASKYINRDILGDLLDELEDHSDDYKKWWRESCEEAKSQREA